MPVVTFNRMTLQDETEPTRRYKGVHFGNLKEKRAEFTGV